MLGLTDWQAQWQADVPGLAVHPEQLLPHEQQRHCKGKTHLLSSLSDLFKSLTHACMHPWQFRTLTIGSALGGFM